MGEELMKRKLLYVEDDEPSRETISLLIRKWYIVDTAKDAEEALEKVRQNSYAAILMDINLGQGTNGIKLSDLIREVEGYENVPIIAVTAYAGMAEKREIMSHQLTHFIAKPFFREELLKLINDAINESATRF